MRSFTARVIIGVHEKFFVTFPNEKANRWGVLLVRGIVGDAGGVNAH